MGTATARLTHGGEDLEFAHVILDNLRAIVPESGVKPLPNELNGRLRAVFVFLGHVKIVNEADGLQLCILGLELVLGPPIEVAFDGFLRPV